MPRTASSNRAGFVGVAVLRLLLLAVVLIEVCFLAGRYSYRVDLTADQAYTLTQSTRKVLSRLEEPLVIEAYFSPDQTLPGNRRPRRVDMRNTLQEYVELGRGKVAVQYRDPFEDRTVRETAERLGLRPLQARSGSSGQLTATEIWQGFRFRYGARKQEVIPYLDFGTTRAYEETFTPLIKRLTVKERPKVGVLAFPSRPGGGAMVIGEKRGRPQGFGFILRQLTRDYDFRPLDTSKGQLVPEDIGVVLLIRPKLLTDRLKFIVDQFLMRGGKLVVFADITEIEVRESREIRGQVPPLDTAGAKLKFLDQLRAYGAVVEQRLVAEGYHELHQALGWQTQEGFRPFYYPYMFEVVKEDWTKAAKDFAQGDAQLQQQYEKLFKPGIPSDHELMRTVANTLPGLLWPCPVGLAEPLPEGVTGQVLMRSSPLSWKDMPGIDLDPFGGALDPGQRQASLTRWNEAKANMRPIRNPVQVPLMVHLEGGFRSFFADKPVPPRTPQADKPDKEPDDWDADPAKKDGKDGDTQGPKPGGTQERKEPEESKLTAAAAGASLLVIGDATFIRDDFIRNEYVQPHPQNAVLGPADKTGNARAARFFVNLMSWLFQDRDLLEIHNRTVADRQMKFATRNDAAGERPEEFMERLGALENRVRWTNALAPMALLVLFGLVLWVRRKAQKRGFLAQFQE